MRDPLGGGVLDRLSLAGVIASIRCLSLISLRLDDDRNYAIDALEIHWVVISR